MGTNAQHSNTPLHLGIVQWLRNHLGSARIPPPPPAKLRVSNEDERREVEAQLRALEQIAYVRGRRLACHVIYEDDDEHAY